jgi:prolyl-tRNA editing enzyme YbaK/EbsC (Cys-tRNA(Pro) deacylase)
LRGPIDVTQALLEAGVAHEVVHLRRRIDDAAELPEVLGQPGTSCVAVRLYEADRGPVAALLPADRTAATTALARAVRSRRLRRPEPGRVSELTEFHPSLVPPFCLPGGVVAVADRALRDAEVLYTTTGDGGTALKVHAEDLFEVTGATVADLVEPGVLVDVTRRVLDDGWRAGAPSVVGSFRR